MLRLAEMEPRALDVVVDSKPRRVLAELRPLLAALMLDDSEATALPTEVDRELKEALAADTAEDTDPKPADRELTEALTVEVAEDKLLSDALVKARPLLVALSRDENDAMELAVAVDRAFTPDVSAALEVLRLDSVADDEPATALAVLAMAYAALMDVLIIEDTAHSCEPVTASLLPETTAPFASPLNRPSVRITMARLPAMKATPDVVVTTAVLGDAPSIA